MDQVANRDLDALTDENSIFSSAKLLTNTCGGSCPGVPWYGVSAIVVFFSLFPSC